jgi:PBP1b-binding outer membrane lipoprotein LpoB
MKKVILSLVLVGALTVVSCKKAEEAPVEEAPVEEVAPVEEEAPVAVDTLATEATEEVAN